MKDIQQFLSTMTGKIIAIVLVLGIGLLIGSRGATHKNEPVAEMPTPTVTAPVAVAEMETAPESKSVVAQKKSAPVAPTPAPVAPSAPKAIRIDGLANINPGAALQENWDADLANDGPVIEIVYLDSNGNIITSDATKKMPISADVKLYAGSDPLAKKDKLVYSGHFDTNQIILGDIYPKIRIPEEQISVDPNTDYYVGVGTVTIHTPDQGDFSATDSFVVLYDK